MRHPRRIAVAALLLAASAAWLCLDGGERAAARGGEWSPTVDRPALPGSGGSRDPVTDAASRARGGARRGTGLDAIDAAVSPHEAADRDPAWRGENGASSDVADPPSGGAGRIALGAPGLRDGPTLQLSVRDPDGPRELWLWRLREGREAVVARTVTGADGAGVFPPLMRSNQELRLVATPAGGNPGDPAASRERRLGARAPEPPWARPIGRRDGSVHLRVTPTEADADVVLAGLDGEEFARFAPARGPHGARRALDLDVSLPRDEEGLLVAHERSDGRRSRWRAVALNGPDESTRRR